MKNIRKSLEKIIFPLFIVVSCFVLQLSSIYSYLFFHSVIELFTVVISFGMFAVTWSSRRFVDNSFLLVLGIGYFYIGGLDLLHVLSYRGMPIFEDRTGNLSTQLWIAARFMEACTFIGAAFMLQKHYPQNRRSNMRKSNGIFYLYLSVTASLLAGIFYWHFYPDMYIDGVGSTFARNASEYMISGLFAVSIALLFRVRKALDPKMFSLITLAIILKIAAELLFSDYVGTYNFTIVLRHLFKFASFLLIYKAILDIGLMDPYRFLFQNLKRSQEEYRQAQKELQQRIREDLDEAYRYIGSSNRKMSILLEVENHSNHKKNRKELVAYIVNVAKSACHASAALIYRHEINGTFKLVFGEGLKKNVMDDLEKVDAKKAEFVKSMIKEKKMINSSCEFSDCGNFNGNGKMSYFVAAPLIVENACKGFLFLGFEDRKSMAQQELEFLNIFSIHISSALAKLGVIR